MYKKFTQRAVVDAYEKRAGTTPVEKSELEIEHEQARAAVAAWGPEAVEKIDKIYAEQKEQAEIDALPDEVQKSLDVFKYRSALDLKGTFKNESALLKATQAPDAPVVDTGSWNADEAVQHMLENAGAVGNDNSKVNWPQFGKGFLYRDESQPEDNVDTYSSQCVMSLTGSYT